MSSPCSVNCSTCTTRIWEGGAMIADGADITGLPFGDITHPNGTTTTISDGQELLTHYANTHCARQDCPHTMTAIATVHVNSAKGLAEQIAELRAKFAALDHRET